MGTVVDSSVLIGVERGDLDLEAVVSKHGEDDIAIAAITASELLHGVHRANTAARRSQREAFVETLLQGIPILPFDLVVARIHARLWAQSASRGQSIGAHDLLIGATAMAHGFAVATRDKRSFPKLKGLKVHVW